MLHKKFVAAAFLVLTLCGSRPVSAVPISVGVISFDTFIAGPGGSNAFFIANLTGDPALGGLALPPDFPVASFLSYQLSAAHYRQAQQNQELAIQLGLR